MRSKQSIQLLVVIVFFIPILAYAVTNWYAKKFGSLPILGPANIKEHVINDFNLTNQDGHNVSTVNWKDKIVIADFFFSHCPTICPVMTANLKKIQKAFENDDEILINSFTVDPIRDTVLQLKNYSLQMNINNRNWQLITGDKKEIYKLARNSFLIVATDGDGGPGDFIHSEKFILVDKHKRIRGYYQGTHDGDTKRLINDIKKLKNEN